MLNSVDRENVAKRNYPFNLELSHLADIELGPIEMRTVRNKEVYSALAMGFGFFIPRGRNGGI